MDDDLLHLVERAILEDIVDSPWSVPDFEIVTISEFFWEFRDLFIEFFFIFFALYLLQEV
jgi:hypothetical protein